MKLKDDKLLVLIAEKNTEAFDVFYHRHIKAMYRFVYHGLKDQELADDLIQEFWVRVWEDASFLKCNSSGDVRGYVFRYLKFRILDLYRKTLAAMLPNPAVEIVEQLPDEYNNIVNDLNEKELLALIHESLAHQPQLIRNTFWMRINNWSVEETADRLSISPKTVYNRYSESLSIVRTYIRKHYPEFAGMGETQTEI